MYHTAPLPITSGSLTSTSVVERFMKEVNEIRVRKSAQGEECVGLGRGAESDMGAVSGTGKAHKKTLTSPVF